MTACTSAFKKNSFKQLGGWSGDAGKIPFVVRGGDGASGAVRAGKCPSASRAVDLSGPLTCAMSAITLALQETVRRR